MTKVLFHTNDSGMEAALLRALARWGHEAISIDTVGRVYAAAVEETPDVLILTTRGLAVETLGLLNDLKADPSTSPIQIILLNSQDDPEGLQGRVFQENGALVCLGGQWTLEQLRVWVEEGVRRSEGSP